MKHIALLAGVAALALSACTPDDTTPVEPTPVETSTPEEAVTPDPVSTPEPVDYSAALLLEGRTAEDLGRDEARKPVEALEYLGVNPGDTVLEMEAGGGYFTTLLAYVVGPEGTVYMQNPAAFDRFWGGGDHPRMASLPSQVTYVRSTFDDLSAVPDASVDVVTWMQGPHELWYMPEGATEPLGDADKTFEEMARVLKPGGRLVVLDHSAPTGSDPSTGGDTHRIDPNHIDMLAASKGLVKTSESQLFDNPDDEMTLNVFDPAIRGKTDQFFFTYTKS